MVIYLDSYPLAITVAFDRWGITYGGRWASAVLILLVHSCFPTSPPTLPTVWIILTIAHLLLTMLVCSVHPLTLLPIYLLLQLTLDLYHSCPSSSGPTTLLYQCTLILACDTLAFSVMLNCGRSYTVFVIYTKVNAPESFSNVTWTEDLSLLCRNEIVMVSWEI